MRLVGYVGGEDPYGQRLAIYEFCAKHGHQVVGIYEDKGVSGALPPRGRPGFSKVLEVLDQVDGVIVYSLDRIARSLTELVDVVREVGNKGKVIISVREDWLQQIGVGSTWGSGRVEKRIAELLRGFVGRKFNGVTVVGVVRQYEVVRQYNTGLGRRADIAVLKDDGTPLLLVEVERGCEAGPWWVAERRFLDKCREGLGQVFSYAAILKRNGVYVPFVAVATQGRIAVFAVPEDVEEHVDWGAVRAREYAHVLPDDYVDGVLRRQYLILHREMEFTEEFFAEILEALTRIYVKGYGQKRH